MSIKDNLWISCMLFIVFKLKWTKIMFLHQISLWEAFKNKDLNLIYKEEIQFFTDLNLIMITRKNPLKKCGNWWAHILELTNNLYKDRSSITLSILWQELDLISIILVRIRPLHLQWEIDLLNLGMILNSTISRKIVKEFTIYHLNFWWEELFKMLLWIQT